jgi:hypothetical protein
MGLAILLAMPEIVKEIKKKLGATEGFGAMVMNAAGARAKQGVPIGTAIPAAGLGAGAGAIGGFGRGMVIEGNWKRGRRGFVNSLGRASRGAGNTMGSFTGATKALSERIGAKSPGLLAPVESRVYGVAGGMTDDSRLKRIAERKNWFGRSAATSGADYARKVSIAEAQADKKTAEEERLLAGQYGQLVEHHKP